jgi:hypothetical protein
MREQTQLQAPVTGIPPGTPLDFRAIHAVANRLTQAAYEGWTQEAREPLPKTLGEPAEHPHRPGSPLCA